ncbi:tRNA(Arg) A34 adenosine deaminase TadA [Rubritalea squalenifaciens DSM 18772]|uniref:tRNA(Arg) A34 adenosine deaminase TadA n=1 Tax=Rubritalea squalenifaciens DSM 18772 TaxID=1123071 RepID=A0A1M6KV24_9BACT|nr:tRNA(Arg) A34 adenosine deaminase TadA [Rubritalea squalenifaciens DSM 18772]
MEASQQNILLKIEGKGPVAEINFTVTLPEWLVEQVQSGSTVFLTQKEKMRFVLELARKNVAQETGGPFAAAVFSLESGELVSAGVNVVVESRCSSAHAEVVALSLAQKAVDSHDLGAAGLPRMVLVSSAEPCAMCMGAIPWSGVKQVICGARDEDVRSVGFDEGAKPLEWVEDFAERGIEVIRDVLREEATEVLWDYRERGGEIY